MKGSVRAVFVLVAIYGLVSTAGATGASFSAMVSGGKIAFVQASTPCSANGVCVTRIAVVDADGSSLHVLTGGHQDGAPSWAPDGKRIAFVRNTKLGCCELAVMSASGGGQRVLMTVSRTSSGYPSLAEVGNPPSWTANGKSILFVDDLDPNARRSPLRSFSVYSVNASGKPVVRRLFGLPGRWKNGTTWRDARESPDGRWIALVKYGYVTSGTNAYRDVKQIWLVDPRGKHLHLVTGAIADGDLGALTWSPDSKRLAFNAYPALCEDGGIPRPALWTVNTDGSGMTPLWTDSCAAKYQVAITGADDFHSLGWSPDGQSLVFAGALGSGLVSLVIADLAAGTFSAVPGIPLIQGCHGPSGSAAVPCGLADPDWSPN